MDGSAFDRRTRVFSTADTRRGLLALLGALPLAGSFVTLTIETEAASRRRHHHKIDRHHAAEREQIHAQRKKKKKKKKHVCVPQSAAQACSGHCGTVADNCGGSVDCGSCTCDQGCPQCQTCNTATGLCDPIANNTPCDDGNACTQTDTCQGGVCVGANPILCPIGKGCVGGACVCDATTCADGCCDAATGTCQTAGNATCGKHGTTCLNCFALGKTCSGNGLCVRGCGICSGSCDCLGNQSGGPANVCVAPSSSCSTANCTDCAASQVCVLNPASGCPNNQVCATPC